MSTGTIEEENEELYNDDVEGLNNDVDALLWTPADLLKSLRYLTDNFAAFKGVGSSGIKVPTVKQRKGFYEAYKECTFKPSINKRSEKLEK